MSQHAWRKEATEGAKKIAGGLHRAAHTENGLKVASEDSFMQGDFFPPSFMPTSFIPLHIKEGTDYLLT